METTPGLREAPGPTAQASLRLLIVDDHEVVTEGLKSVLAQDERVTVVGVAQTGAEARMLARRTLPDVVILDMHLPDVPGEDACRQLRALLPSLIVIVLSSYLNGAAVRSARNRVSSRRPLSSEWSFRRLSQSKRRSRSGRCTSSTAGLR